MVVSAHAMASRDRLTMQDGPGTSAHANYDDRYLWINLRRSWTDALFTQSVLSWGSMERDREGAFDNELDLQRGQLEDHHQSTFLTLKNDATLHLSPRQLLKFGATAKRTRARFDVEGSSVIPFAIFELGSPPREVRRSVHVRPGGSQLEAYVADRVRIRDSVVVEAGLRAGSESYTPDGVHVSPRLNVAWTLSPHTSVRAAWGLFHQPHAMHELQVEDGVTEYQPAQRSEHRVLGIERSFPRGFAARLELYDKTLTRPRPRYGNLYDRLLLFPELRADRIRIAPEKGHARGAELLVRSDASQPLSGWMSYTMARVTDRLGDRDVPRDWDQRHAATFSVNYQRGPEWNFNLAGTWHSGWPTTPVLARAEGTRLLTELGPRASARLPDYQRLDFRASRTAGAFSFFVELFNVLGRENVTRVDTFEFRQDPNGAVTASPVTESVIGILPSFGVSGGFDSTRRPKGRPRRRRALVHVGQLLTARHAHRPPATAGDALSGVLLLARLLAFRHDRFAGYRRRSGNGVTPRDDLQVLSRGLDRRDDRSDALELFLRKRDVSGDTGLRATVGDTHECALRRDRPTDQTESVEAVNGAEHPAGTAHQRIVDDLPRLAMTVAQSRKGAVRVQRPRDENEVSGSTPNGSDDTGRTRRDRTDQVRDTGLALAVVECEAPDRRSIRCDAPADHDERPVTTPHRRDDAMIPSLIGRDLHQRDLGDLLRLIRAVADSDQFTVAFEPPRDQHEITGPIAHRRHEQRVRECNDLDVPRIAGPVDARCTPAIPAPDDRRGPGARTKLPTDQHEFSGTGPARGHEQPAACDVDTGGLPCRRPAVGNAADGGSVRTDRPLNQLQRVVSRPHRGEHLPRSTADRGNAGHTPGLGASFAHDEGRRDPGTHDILHLRGVAGAGDVAHFEIARIVAADARSRIGRAGDRVVPPNVHQEARTRLVGDTPFRP